MKNLDDAIPKGETCKHPDGRVCEFYDEVHHACYLMEKAATEPYVKVGGCEDVEVI